MSIPRSLLDYQPRFIRNSPTQAPGYKRAVTPRRNNSTREKRGTTGITGLLPPVAWFRLCAAAGHAPVCCLFVLFVVSIKSSVARASMALKSYGTLAAPPSCSYIDINNTPIPSLSIVHSPSSSLFFFSFSFFIIHAHTHQIVIALLASFLRL